MKKQLISQSVLKKLYVVEKHSIKWIAKYLQRGEATVLSYLRKYEIQTRPQQQWLGRKHTQKTKELIRKKQLGKTLSKETKKKISIALKGRKHYWRDRRVLNSNGYVMLFQPENPMSNSGGYVPEHRFVMANKLGRILKREESVHHINGKKDDNRLENLVVLTKGGHTSLHESKKEMKEWRSKMMKEKRKNKFWSTKKAIKIN